MRENGQNIYFLYLFNDNATWTIITKTKNLSSHVVMRNEMIELNQLHVLSQIRNGGRLMNLEEIFKSMMKKSIVFLDLFLKADIDIRINFKLGIIKILIINKKC